MCGSVWNVYKCRWNGWWILLWGKPIGNGEGRQLKVICGPYNHHLSKSLVGHPFADRLKSHDHSMVVDITKCSEVDKHITYIGRKQWRQCHNNKTIV